MTKEELIRGYENEINYQKHMLGNLRRWMALWFMTAGVGFVLVYFFHNSLSFLLFVAILLMSLGILGSLVFGYGIYKGKQNLEKVFHDFEKQLMIRK